MRRSFIITKNRGVAMNINKALRKQKKSNERFMLSMGFIFFLLPAIVYVSKSFSTFLLIYLVVIEILVIIVILVKLDKEILKFGYVSRLKVQNGILGERYSIDCHKVEVVHTINEEKELEIVIILESKLRNKRIRRIDSKFLKNNSWANKYYNNLKNNKSSKDYYYIVLNKGGYVKYKLLDVLYKYCTNAHFTDEAIKNIKEYRN
jgi:hypothetical protein